MPAAGRCMLTAPPSRAGSSRVRATPALNLLRNHRLLAGRRLRGTASQREEFLEVLASVGREVEIVAIHLLVATVAGELAAFVLGRSHGSLHDLLGLGAAAL